MLAEQQWLGRLLRFLFRSRSRSHRCTRTCCLVGAALCCCVYVLLWMRLWKDQGGKFNPDLDRISQIDFYTALRSEPWKEGEHNGVRRQSCGTSSSDKAGAQTVACKCADAERIGWAPHPERGTFLHRQLRCLPDRNVQGRPFARAATSVSPQVRFASCCCCCR